jgi:very-short-patch-repair endonuclease
MKSVEESVISMYQDENKSTYEIAEILNTYPNKIRRILKKHGHDLKNHSQAQKNALNSGRKDHPTLGKERTYQEKLKISSSLSEHWENLSEQERKARSDNAKERWENMSEIQKDRICQMATEAIRKAGKEGSKFEKFLYSKLEEAGFKIEYHKKNLIPNEKLEIDLYVPDLKTIIEIDGPSHFWPVWGDEKLQKQIKADLHKSGLLLGKGFVIIRLKLLKTISLSRQEEIVKELVDNLNAIKVNFPPRSKRFIEIEL